VITQESIEAYIEKIPPVPKILIDTMSQVDLGELVKASQIAEKDPALKSYLISLVNNPYFGFVQQVTSISQIFGILGQSKVKQVLYSYMMSLLDPSEWKLFKLNKRMFHQLQATLSSEWSKILSHENIDDKDIMTSVSLLPASIIVCENLFKDVQNDVNLLRSAKNLDYSTILKRLTNKNLFDVSEMIAKKWNMSDASIEIIKAASGSMNSKNKNLNKLGKWMHLLLFFILSKPEYIEAGLNNFIEFNVEYVEDVYEPFMKLMDIS
jgi:HD-like signal output (HDOD) protein